MINSLLKGRCLRQLIEKTRWGNHFFILCFFRVRETLKNLIPLEFGDQKTC